MLYVIDQRLKAQRITLEKSAQGKMNEKLRKQMKKIISRIVFR